MPIQDRDTFLNTAGLFEGGLGLAALFVGWLLGVDPFAHLELTWRGALWGSLAALPIFGLFVLADHLPIRSLQRIGDLLVDLLGPPLSACRWYELALVALLAGLGEELLFRGLMQVWMERFGETAALVGSNVLFGLAHAVTPAYAVVAGLIGGYLGWLLDATGERNLLVPIMAHAVYDFLGFLMVARHYRQREREASGEQDEPPGGKPPESGTS